MFIRFRFYRNNVDPANTCVVIQKNDWNSIIKITSATIKKCFVYFLSNRPTIIFIQNGRFLLPALLIIEWCQTHSTRKILFYLFIFYNENKSFSIQFFFTIRFCVASPINELLLLMTQVLANRNSAARFSWLIYSRENLNAD